MSTNTRWLAVEAFSPRWCDRSRPWSVANGVREGLLPGLLMNQLPGLLMSLLISLLISLLTQARASAQTGQTRPTTVRSADINLASVRVGLQGQVRFNRWSVLTVQVSAQGADDAPVIVEVLSRDLDGDVVRYARRLVVAQLANGPVEIFFQPNVPVWGTRELVLTLLVRNGTTNDVLARETVRLTVIRDSQPGGSAVPNAVSAIAPHRRLVGFLGPSTDSSAGPSVRKIINGFENFLRRFDAPSGQDTITVSGLTARWAGPSMWPADPDILPQLWNATPGSLFRPATCPAFRLGGKPWTCWYGRPSAARNSPCSNSGRCWIGWRLAGSSS